MWPRWHFGALPADLEHHIPGMAPLRWARNDPALHELKESPGFSRNNYLYSAQSEIRGVWKEDIGGTRRFPAYKERF